MILDLVKEMQDEIPFYREACLKNLFSWQELENLLNLRPFMNDVRFKILNDSYKLLDHKLIKMRGTYENRRQATHS